VRHVSIGSWILFSLADIVHWFISSGLVLEVARVVFREEVGVGRTIVFLDRWIEAESCKEQLLAMAI